MRIDIWSDVICPWCYLGAVRFRRAVASLPAADRDRIEVHWRAFQLDPHAPADPSDLRGSLDRRYGPGAFDAMTARLTALGRDEGVDYRFDRARRVNTFDAHRLLAWSGTPPEAGGPNGGGPDAQQRLLDALFAAHFTDGADVSSRDTLAAAARRCGLDGEEAARWLSGDGGAEGVRADVATATDLGITGVPAFVVAGAVLIPGAQDTPTMQRLLGRALARHP